MGLVKAQKLTRQGMTLSAGHGSCTMIFLF